MNKVYVALCNCCPLCCVSVWSALLVNVTLPKMDSVCYNSPLQCLHSVLDVFMENELIILNLPWKKTNKQKKPAVVGRKVIQNRCYVITDCSVIDLWLII